MDAVDVHTGLMSRTTALSLTHLAVVKLCRAASACSISSTASAPTKKRTPLTRCDTDGRCDPLVAGLRLQFRGIAFQLVCLKVKPYLTRAWREQLSSERSQGPRNDVDRIGQGGRRSDDCSLDDPLDDVRNKRHQVLGVLRDGWRPFTHSTAPATTNLRELTDKHTHAKLRPSVVGIKRHDSQVAEHKRFVSVCDRTSSAHPSGSRSKRR